MPWNIQLLSVVALSCVCTTAFGQAQPPESLEQVCVGTTSPSVEKPVPADHFDLRVRESQVDSKAAEVLLSLPIEMEGFRHQFSIFELLPRKRYRINLPTQRTSGDRYLIGFQVPISDLRKVNIRVQFIKSENCHEENRHYNVRLPAKLTD